MHTVPPRPQSDAGCAACDGALASCQACLPPTASRFWYYSPSDRRCHAFQLAALTTGGPRPTTPAGAAGRKNGKPGKPGKKKAAPAPKKRGRGLL